LLEQFVNKNEKPIILPFLKWAGGKRWLVSNHADLFDVKYERYVEPFLGGGAIFFSQSPNKALLADTNGNLIETYKQIRDDWPAITKTLAVHQKKHCKEYYYKIRSSTFSKPSARASQFLYLNRTCWNGLYRLNKKGEFNVPIGTKTAVVLKTDDFQGTSALLENADLRTQDFETTLETVGIGDFVYIDPPYTVNHKHNGFLKYNEKIFSWDDQVRLKNCIVKAIERGAKIVISNADHISIRELYEDIGELQIFSRASVIAGSSAKRGQVDELVIKANF
jgi:DNA adenine methylase